MIRRSILAALAIAISPTFASALDTNVSKVTSVSPAQAWEAIGDFCGISAWHPAVATCKLSEVMGAKLRLITLKDGGTVREQLVEQNNDALIQKSLFLDGALPISNYQATLKVVVTGDGTTYTWSGNFLANGVSDDEAVKSITSFYSAGVDGLVAKSKK